MEILFSGNVYDLAKFDEQDFVDEYLSECYAEAYDEKLDYYVDKAMSAASNAFAELAEDAKDEADMLLKRIEELETLAKKVLKLFKSLPLNDIRIDNTMK
jgi:cell division septum initiation protein DivIVA